MLNREFEILSDIVIRAIAIVCITILPFMASAQQINGTTGLLSSPSAEMQRDGTAMIGGNFLNKHISPPVFPYNTYNYYLNITFLPFMEVAYSCTFFRKVTDGKVGRVVNQDRNFSLRLRPLKESKYVPAVVIGSNDLYTTKGSFMSNTTSNQYFANIYIAASKHFKFGKGEVLGAHCSYIYGPRYENQLEGIAAGVTYVPSIAPTVKFIAEYDSSDINLGVESVFFKHLYAQVILQDMKYLSAGIAYKIYLKKQK